MKVYGQLEHAQLETTPPEGDDRRVKGRIWIEDGEIHYGTGGGEETLSPRSEGLLRKNLIVSGPNETPIARESGANGYPNFIRPLGEASGTQAVGGTVLASASTPLILRIDGEEVEITTDLNITGVVVDNDMNFRLAGLDAVGTDVFSSVNRGNAAFDLDRVGDQDFAYYSLRDGFSDFLRLQRGRVQMETNFTASEDIFAFGSHQYNDNTTPANTINSIYLGWAFGGHIHNLQKNLAITSNGKLFEDIAPGPMGPMTRYTLHRVFIHIDDGADDPKAVAYSGTIFKGDTPPAANTRIVGDLWYHPGDDRYEVVRSESGQNVWRPTKRIEVGLLISKKGVTGTLTVNDSTIAAISHVWSRDYRAENNIEVSTPSLDINRTSIPGSGMQIRSGGRVSVMGKTLDVDGVWVSEVLNDAPSGLANNASVMCFLCVTETGQLRLSAKRPRWRQGLKGYYIPGRTWRVVGEALGRFQASDSRVFFRNQGTNRVQHFHDFIWEKYALHGRIPMKDTVTLNTSLSAIEHGGASIFRVLSAITDIPDVTGVQAATVGVDNLGGGFLEFRPNWFKERPIIELKERWEIVTSAPNMGVAVAPTFHDLVFVDGADYFASIPGGGRSTVTWGVAGATGDPFYHAFFNIKRASTDTSGTDDVTSTGGQIVGLSPTLVFSRRPVDEAQTIIDNSLKVV